MERGNTVKIEQLDLPIVRAKFRVLWRECAKREGLASLPSTAAAPVPAATSSAGSSKSSKELPPGWWQMKIAEYESVVVAGAHRKFPQEMLLGAESVLARMVNEMKTLQHTAVGLQEFVQARLFTAAGEPNSLNSARKKSRQGLTVLTVNEENQLEAEPDAPWYPKSSLAFIDCLESIRFAYLLVGIGKEQAVDVYVDWWIRQVRSRQQKLDQLRVYWEVTSWKIAIALRTKIPFEDVTSDLMKDTQALQDAMAREIPIEKITKKFYRTNG